LDAGYDVRLVTLPEMDVREYEPPSQVHGVLAAPPCTEFAVSGARWWASKDKKLLRDALSVVSACFSIIEQVHPRWWALENPVGRLRRLLSLGEPRLTFNPCDYGDPWTKVTQVWGVFELPVPRPVTPTEGSKIHLMPPSPERARLRSLTPPGFARAFFEANP
jgi:hypothetical protein